MPTMLHKHYVGLMTTFPDLTEEDAEKLFYAGLVTPGHVKSAEDAEIEKILGKSKAKKVKDKKNEILGTPPAP